MSSVDNIEELKNRLRSLGVVLQSVPPSEPSATPPAATEVVNSAVVELKRLLETPDVQNIAAPRQGKAESSKTEDAALNRSIAELQNLLEQNHRNNPSSSNAPEPDQFEHDTPKHKKRNHHRKAESKDAALKGIPYSKSVPHSPLAILLAKLKENEEDYKEEKAQLRREARQASKRAFTLEQDVVKLQAQLKYNSTETKALLAALKARDNQMYGLQQRLDGLEAALGPSGHPSHFEEKYKSVSNEKAELQEILENTVHKFESVSTAYQECSELVASLETKLADMDLQRAEAYEVASTAKAQAEELAANQQKHEWQLSVLEKLVEIHCSGNQKKVEAIRRVIHSQHTADDLVVLLNNEKKGHRRRNSVENELYGASLLPPSFRTSMAEPQPKSKHRSKR